MAMKMRTGDEAIRAVLFSNNLRFILRNGPIGRAQLAKKIGVTPATIGTYTSGRIFPNEERIQEIAAALGCTVDELFADTDAPWNFGTGEEY